MRKLLDVRAYTYIISTLMICQVVLKISFKKYQFRQNIQMKLEKIVENF